MSITKEYLKELFDEPTKEINWFKDGVHPKMKGFNVIYKQKKVILVASLKSNSFQR